jgi:hypothetical protein
MEIQKSVKVIDVIGNQKATIKGFRFVISAKAMQHTRHALNCILVTPNKIIGTDGRRLHIFNCNNEYETGLYEVVLNTTKRVVLFKSDTDSKFPKWEDSVPKYKQYFTICGCNDTDRNISKTIACLGKKDVAVNITYLFDVFKLGEDFKIYFKSPDSPIYVKNEKFEIILMPFSAELDKVVFFEDANDPTP